MTSRHNSYFSVFRFTHTTMTFISSLLHGIALAADMAWETWWALVLGFTLTGAVEEFVTERQMTRYLGDDGWREAGLGTLFGIASSSCSFSAAATAKTLFKKGASPVTSLGAFQFAATDLVVELGLVMWILLGWQFVAADFVGGLVAVAVLVLIYRRVPDSWFERAREHVRKLDGVTCAACGMDAPPEDDDTVTLETEGRTRYFCCSGCQCVYENRDHENHDESPSLTSRKAWERAASSSVKEWDMLWEDIAIGYVISGLIAALVPKTWWAALFGTGETGFFHVASNSVLAVIIGVVTFVCSVGNIPFALVLWQKGIAFGSVLAFIFADLIIPPLVNAYRNYYGDRIAATLFAAMFVASVVAGIVVHYLFSGLGLIPPQGVVSGTAPDDYTFVLNLLVTPVFLAQVTVSYGPERVKTLSTDLPGIAARKWRDLRRSVGLVTDACRIVASATTDLGSEAWRAGTALRKAGKQIVLAVGLLGEALRGFADSLSRAGTKLREAYEALR